MKSLFELKTKMPYDLDVLEDMKATAFDLLCNTKKEKYTQFNLEFLDILHHRTSKT